AHRVLHSFPTRRSSDLGEQTIYSTNIFVSASAFGGSGSIVSVAIYGNNQKVAEFTDRPYSFSWTNSPAGTEVLTAVATDSSGVRSEDHTSELQSLAYLV